MKPEVLTRGCCGSHVAVDAPQMDLRGIAVRDVGPARSPAHIAGEEEEKEEEGKEDEEEHFAPCCQHPAAAAAGPGAPAVRTLAVARSLLEPPAPHHPESVGEE